MLSFQFCYVTNSVHAENEKMIKFLALSGPRTSEKLFLRCRAMKKESLRWLNICILSLTRVMCFNVLFNENKLYLVKFIASS